MTASGTYLVLYTFTGGADGGLPIGGVARDSTGNLYGTTYSGGSTGCGGTGCGVVYQVSPVGQETVLHSFTGGNGWVSADGGQSEAGVVLDPAGGLYGTCPYGGAANGGVVFRAVLQ